jgi:hypothetical protein
MKTITISKYGWMDGWMATILAIVVTLFMAAAAPSYAGIVDHQDQKSESMENGGNVLPPKAQPKGYSLSDMAKATAAFNVTYPRPDVFPDVVNGKPFQGLFTTPANTTNTFNVKQDTMLYVPVLAIDDSPTIIGTFPKVGDQKALEFYFYNHSQLGTHYTNITVDGKVTSLNDDYVVEVKVAPLPDGFGTQYIAAAAFLTPLKKGHHTVEISAFEDGDAMCAAIAPNPCPWQFSVVYNVIVH